MTREELVDELRDVLSDACDMDVTFGMYAEAAVRCLEKHGVFREWQTMETAPKDGSRFWGKVDDDAIAMLWHPKFEQFVSRWQRMVMAPGYTFNDEKEHDHSPRVHQPTHWMPLPAEPKS